MFVASYTFVQVTKENKESKTKENINVHCNNLFTCIKRETIQIRSTLLKFHPTKKCNIS